MTGDLEIGTASPAADAEPRPRAPWLVVVTRGHARLVAEIQAVFCDDSRVKVIENRREGHALLPRAETFTRASVPGA